MELNQLIEAYPRLYHMAECDAWPSIQQNGLRSTTAILDWLDVDAATRFRMRSEHRPEMMTVSGNGRTVMLRDQKPMPPSVLAGSLINDATPQQWYETINDKCFFWAEESRLLRLLGAKWYRNKQHDVLTLDTASFVAAHAPAIWLCHMNSGACIPWKTKRDFTIFKRIPDYPVKRSGKPDKPVVEVVVDYEVSDVADHVIEVRRMRGAECLGTIYRP